MENKHNVFNGSFETTNQKDNNCFLTGRDETMQYYIDGGKLDDFRSVWDNGLELWQVNQENMIESKERRISMLQDRMKDLRKQHELEVEFPEKRNGLLQVIADKKVKLDNELISMRGQYARAKAFFTSNPWVLSASTKTVPEWASQKAVEDNLDNFVGEGIMIKETLARTSQNYENVAFDIEYDSTFGITNEGYLATRISNLDKAISWAQQDVNYDAKKLDMLLAGEEEEYFASNIKEKKVYDMPNEDWTDEQLVMLISTSEDGRGVYAAEEILDKRYEQYVLRMQNKAIKAQEEVNSMADMVKVADMFDAANRATRSLAKIEETQIVRENRTEQKRLESIANPKEGAMVFVVRDKAWYDSKGRETTNPDKVSYGWTDVILVPKKHIADAMYYRAFDRLCGSVKKIAA